MRFGFLLFCGGIFFGGLLLGGCASDNAAADPTRTPRVSTIPWNTPQPGEGAIMGGMMNTR